MTVGEGDFPHPCAGKSHRSSAFRSNQGDGNLIAGLDGIPVPAVLAKNVHALRFDRPTHNVPFLVFYIEVNLAMGIGPNEFRHGSLDGDRMIGIVSGIAMMSLQRAASQYKG